MHNTSDTDPMKINLLVNSFHSILTTNYCAVCTSHQKYLSRFIKVAISIFVELENSAQVVCNLTSFDELVLKGKDHLTTDFNINLSQFFLFHFLHRRLVFGKWNN